MKNWMVFLVLGLLAAAPVMAEESVASILGLSEARIQAVVTNSDSDSGWRRRLEPLCQRFQAKFPEFSKKIGEEGVHRLILAFPHRIENAVSQK